MAPKRILVRYRLHRRVIFAYLLVVAAGVAGFLRLESLAHTLEHEREARVQAIALLLQNAEKSTFTVCVEVEKLKQQIRATITQSNKTLREIEYYQQHPQELADAVARNKAVLERFKAVSCEDLPPSDPEELTEETP